MVVIPRASHTADLLEPFVLGAGGLLAAAAHWANIRLCRCCGECVARSHGPDPAPSRTSET
jgi:hypothetical protein